MNANPDMLYKKLQQLPPQRLTEVEDFVDFLARDETRRAALDRLLEIAAALEAAGIPPMSMEEINAEVKAARAERPTRETAADSAAPSDHR